MSNPWFRMYKEFATDPVIQSLEFDEQRHYIVILCLKCDGVIDRNISTKARDRVIFKALGLPQDQAEIVKKSLIEMGLIAKNWQPKGWDKRQYVSDNSTLRSKKSKARKTPAIDQNSSKSLNGNGTGNVPETFEKQHSNGPDTEADTEADIKEKTKEKRFAKPSFDDLEKYKQEKKLNLDSQAFLNHYDSNGWKVGRNSMKDWQATARNWATRQSGFGNQQPQQKQYEDFPQ